MDDTSNRGDSDDRDDPYDLGSVSTKDLAQLMGLPEDGVWNETDLRRAYDELQHRTQRTTDGAERAVLSKAYETLLYRTQQEDETTASANSDVRDSILRLQADQGSLIAPQFRDGVTLTLYVDSLHRDISKSAAVAAGDEAITSDGDTTNISSVFTYSPSLGGIQNVTSLSLVSVNIPMTWFAFSLRLGTTSFVVGIYTHATTSYSRHYCVIPDGNYSPAGLVAALNDAQAAAQPLIPAASHIVFNIDAGTGRLQAALTAPLVVGDAVVLETYGDGNSIVPPTEPQPQYPSLARTLGTQLGLHGAPRPNPYNSGAVGVWTEIPSVVPPTYRTIGQSPVNLCGPRYFFLLVDELSNHQAHESVVHGQQHETISGETGSRPSRFYRLFTTKNLLAKIDLHDATSTQSHTDSESLQRAWVWHTGAARPVYTRPYHGPIRIQSIRTALVDEWGIPVDLNGRDWSFVLHLDRQYRRPGHTSQDPQ